MFTDFLRLMVTFSSLSPAFKSKQNLPWKTPKTQEQANYPKSWEAGSCDLQLQGQIKMGFCCVISRTRFEIGTVIELLLPYRNKSAGTYWGRVARPETQSTADTFKFCMWLYTVVSGWCLCSHMHTSEAIPAACLHAVGACKVIRGEVETAEARGGDLESFARCCIHRVPAIAKKGAF